MKILITGAGGFLGSCLVEQLLKQKGIMLNGTKFPIDELVLVDIFSIKKTYSLLDTKITKIVCNLTDHKMVKELFNENYNVVFHLAAVVSGQAEREFELGYSGNIEATVNILNNIKEQKHSKDSDTRFFMTSSLAVFGRGLPQSIPDTFPCVPLSSYGTQKAICELYTLDYSRKGYCDGRVLRLPTVTVRPGQPNAAASSFVSSIIREPLQNREATCPIPFGSTLWIISPKVAIESILYMVSLPQEKIQNQRIIHPLGLTVTVEQMLSALEEVGGIKARNLVQCQRDKQIEDIVLSWPSRFDSNMAKELGFPRNIEMSEIVKEFYRTL